MKARQKYGTLQTLAADLVINASGRNTQLPKWLETLGYPQAPETVINSFLGYASRWYRPNTVGDAIQGVIVSNKPGVTCRGGVLWPGHDRSRPGSVRPGTLFSTNVIPRRRFFPWFSAVFGQSAGTPLAYGHRRRFSLTTIGVRPGWVSKRIQGYFDRVAQAANADSRIHADFIKVAHLAELCRGSSNPVPYGGRSPWLLVSSWPCRVGACLS